VAGALLRLWSLGPQVLGGDETHALRAALSHSLSGILVTYQESDNCIPLTALYKLWGMAGGGLSETVLRLPVVLCGLAALWWIPRAFGAGAANGGASSSGVSAADGDKALNEAGSAGAVTLPPPRIAVLHGWLLALSPALVLYSRIARSYMPMVLFSYLAVAAFWRCWQTGSRRAGAAYVGLGALAVWFHLGAATLVVAPGLYAVVDLVLSREARHARMERLARLLFLGGGMGVAVALFLVPAGPSLLALLGEKRQAQDIPWRSELPDLLRLQAGTASLTLVALFFALALVGLGVLWRLDRRLALFLATVVLGHVVGLLLLSPLGLASPLILGRYLLPVLPYLLFWIACGLGMPWSGAGLARFARPAFATLFLAALFFFGPFADRDRWRSSFQHHNDFVAFYAPRVRLAPEAAPDFYRRLAAEPGAGAVIEYPWLAVWEANRSFYAYQAIHRRRVLVSTPQRLLFRPPAALRNAVAPDPAAFCRSGARYLILHTDVDREEDRIARAAGRAVREPVVSRRMRRQLRDMASALSGRLAAAWGAPIYDDGWLEVWDLARSCAGAGVQSPAAAASAASAIPPTKLAGR
jgi:hypothetical protein